MSAAAWGKLVTMLVVGIALALVVVRLLGGKRPADRAGYFLCLRCGFRCPLSDPAAADAHVQNQLGHAIVPQYETTPDR